MTVIERSGIDAKSRDNEEDGKQSSADEQGQHQQHDQQDELEKKKATRPQQQLGAPSAAAPVAASLREEEHEESPRPRYWILLDERIRRGRGRLLPQGNEPLRLENQALFSPLSPRLEDFARRDEEGDASNEDRQHVRFGEQFSSPSNIGTFQAREERAPSAAPGAAMTTRGDGAGVAEPAPHNQQLALPILQDRQTYAIAPTSRSGAILGRVAGDAPKADDHRVAVSLSVLEPPQTSASSNGSGGYEGGSEEEELLAEDEDPDDNEQHDVTGWVETLFDLLEEQQVDGANKVVLGSTTTGGIDGGPEELEEAGDAVLEAPAVAITSDRKAAVGTGRSEQEGKTSGAGWSVSPPEKGRREKHGGFQAVASKEEVEALVRSTTPLTSNKKKFSVKPQRPPNESAALPRVQRRRTRIIEEEDEGPRSRPVVPDAAGGGYSLSSLVAVSSAQLVLAQVAGGAGEESMMVGAQLQDQQQEEASIVVQQNAGPYYYYSPNRNDQEHGPTSHTNQPSRLQVHFASARPATGLTNADMEPFLHMPPAANYDDLGSSSPSNVPSSSSFRCAEPPLEANVPSWVQEHNRQQNERRLQQQLDEMEGRALSNLHQSLEMTPVPCLLTLTSFPFRVAHANGAYGKALGQSSVLAIGASFFDIIEELEPPSSSQPTRMAPPRRPPPTFSNCSSLVGRYREDEVVRVFGANSSSSGGASCSKTRSRKATTTRPSEQEQQQSDGGGESSKNTNNAAANSERQYNNKEGERVSIFCNIKVEAVMRRGSLPAATATSSSSLVCQEYPESRSSLLSVVGPSSLIYFVVRLTPVPFSPSAFLSQSTLSPSDLLSLLQSQYQESLKQEASSSKSSPARGRSRKQK